MLTKNGTEKLKRTDERNLDIKSRGKDRVKNIGVRSKSVHLEIFRPCWRCMANSLKDRIEFVGLGVPLRSEGWLGRVKGA